MTLVLRMLFLLCLLGGQWAVSANVPPAPAASSCCAGKETRDCARGSPGNAACMPGQGCCVGWIAVLQPAIAPVPMETSVISFPAFSAQGTALTYPPPLPPPR